MEQKKLTLGKLLNVYGNLNEVGYATSLVREYNRSDIKARKMRIKEWDYYYIGNQHYGVALTIDDNSYMGLGSVSVLDFDNDFWCTRSVINWFLVSALEAMIPSFLKAKYRKFLYCANPDSLDMDLAMLFNGKNKIAISYDTIKENPKILREVKKGNIEVSYDVFQYGKNKKEKLYSVNPMYDHLIESLSSMRYEVMMYVKRNDFSTSLAIREAVGCSTYLIKSLVNEGYLLVKEDYVTEKDDDEEKKLNKAFSFSFEEKELIEKFTQLSGKPFLLYSNDEDFKLDFHHYQYTLQY